MTTDDNKNDDPRASFDQSKSYTAADDERIIKQKQQQRKRPIFYGGTMSLNAYFFSATLMMSRLESNVNAFTFIQTSIAAFAYYPSARHNISKEYGNSIGMCRVHVFNFFV
eukprot:CAMPEP_0171326286 /NCGR_PEP_ID=MMETSP0816-20121228/117357_1 /TAXON_ID=420281 /ORGANISM="Proboscia inermis, Strain CCAP1064/1" /LENGTH=110 /DNA_ID=CAMNT_0011825709 /DNA_START=168 /DNA_END=500 /DNA_ORIENTATION=+